MSVNAGMSLYEAVEAALYANVVRRELVGDAACLPSLEYLRVLAR